MTAQLPPLSFPSSWPTDEHAFCPCGSLMCFDAATGTLVCDDCRTDALDGAAHGGQP